MADQKRPPPPKPFRLTTVPSGRWYRVHKFDPVTAKYKPTQFNNTNAGNARFSPLEPVRGTVVPTIYAAATRAGAIAEVILHDVPTPSDGHIHNWTSTKTQPWHLSEIELADLKLVNLTSTGMRAAGLRVADLFNCESDEYHRTREWAVHIWKTHPDAQGLQWMSVRDNTAMVVMLFGDRLQPGDIADGGVSKHIAQHSAEVFQLLDDLGCGML